MSNKCACCNKTSESHRLVRCCVCKKPFNIDCVGLSTVEARKLHSNEGLSWSCTKCRDLGNDIISLKSVIVSLQDEIVKFKETVTPSKLSNLLNIERTVAEFQEREKRKNNIMIYGVKEGIKISKKEQEIKDVDLLTQVFTSLQITHNDIKPVRCGKYDANIPLCRPIKVNLPSSDDVITLLKNTSKLREMDNYKHIRFSSDRTQMQTELYKEMKQELESRISKGETDISIKYVRGVPTIVKTNSVN